MVAPLIQKSDQYDVVVNMCRHVFEEGQNLSSYVEFLKQYIDDLVSACSSYCTMSGKYQLAVMLANQSVASVQEYPQLSLVYDIAMEDQILCFAGK
jgi:hypothetical protein